MCFWHRLCGFSFFFCTSFCFAEYFFPLQKLRSRSSLLLDCSRHIFFGIFRQDPPNKYHDLGSSRHFLPLHRSTKRCLIVFYQKGILRIQHWRWNLKHRGPRWGHYYYDFKHYWSYSTHTPSRVSSEEIILDHVIAVKRFSRFKRHPYFQGSIL